jgi:hypothetical protein
MMVATVRYVPESRAPRPRRINLPGQLLIIAALGALTYAVIQGPVASGLCIAAGLALPAPARRPPRPPSPNQDNSKKRNSPRRRRYPASSASSRASTAGSKPSFSGPPRPISQARVSRIVSVIGRQTRPAPTAREESTSLNAS